MGLLFFVGALVAWGIGLILVLIVDNVDGELIWASLFIGLICYALSRALPWIQTATIVKRTQG